MSQRFYKSASVALPLCLSFALLAPGLRVVASDLQTAKKQAAKPTTILRRIGEVTVAGLDSVTTHIAANGKSLDADLHGNPVTITSARYDLSGNRILVSLKGQLVNTATANGSVDVHIRNPEQQQRATLTCATATYFGATPAAPAHLDLAGHVHAIQYAPMFDQPLDAISESGKVVFLPDGSYTLSLGPTTATVTPIEPAAAPKTKK